MSQPVKAIVLNGPGRSGTTLVYQILAYHEDLSWISNLVNKYPNLPFLSVLNRVYTKKWIGKNWHTVKNAPKPAEAYHFWKHFYGISTADDVALIEEKKTKVRSTLQKICWFSGSKTLLLKVTGNSRKRIFESLFTDFQVVWIERDPRVVVSSYIKAQWFFRDKPEEFKRMSEEEKLEFYCNYYLNTGKHAQAYSKAIRVNYEDLMADKTTFFKDLCQKIGLPFTPRFAKIVADWPIKEVGWDFYKEKYSAAGVELLHKKLGIINTKSN